MRLSSSMIYQQNMQSITNAYSKYQSAALDLSNGQLVNKPSDDPIASSQAVVLAQSQSTNEQFATARDTATTNLSLESTVLDQVTDVIQNVQTLLVKAASTTYSDSDRQSMKTELQGYKDQLLTLANTTDSNGNYIFAGYKTDTAPFVEDSEGNVSYVGSDTPVSQKVDSSRTMTTGDTGTTIFMSLSAGYKTEPDGSASETNMFNSIDYALTALDIPLDETGDDTTSSESYQAMFDKANRGMSNSLDNVSTVQATVGSKLNELTTLDSIGDSRDLIYSDRMTSLKGSDVDDMYEMISNVTMQKVALQAAQSTFSSMKGMSLFEMNS
ncbi:flagellar hook-associated protein FlgL [Lonsdalea quercina]|uniref:Flagellar hook-associated protein 3 FlgL n=1 Tax=Lonsdalea quercina TaxID=71657 RepID=A0A1H3VID1_9GAMM|nr:flagellar hook-associated protein FlgL [Lonsdalea quercina]SDZ74431.1 flagellar hook-associated protein 3 FlgL [Lonsdalea quercina]